MNLLHRAEVLRDAVLAATIAAASFTMGNDGEERINPLSLHSDLSSKLSLSRAFEHTFSDPVNDENGDTATFKDCFGDILDHHSPLLSQCVVDMPSRAVPEPWVRGEEHMDETAFVEMPSFRPY